MLTQNDVVYDLQVENGRPILRLVAIETRRRVSHDDAADIEGIPDIFIAKSLPGMKQAVWEAHCPPMRAMGAMTDTGIYAVEDIDRLAALKLAVVEEEKKKAFSEQMKEFMTRVVKNLEASGAFLLPTPPARAAAYAVHKEMDRRGKLAADKLEAAMRGESPAPQI